MLCLFKPAAQFLIFRYNIIIILYKNDTFKSSTQKCFKSEKVLAAR